MRNIFRTRRPTNFKLGRRTEPRFAKVNILILLLRAATNQSTQQYEASRGLSAIAELLVKLGRAYQLEFTTAAHADAVAGLPLPGLRRTAEPVQSTRLQTPELPPFVRVTGNNGFLTTSLLTKRLHA